MSSSDLESQPIDGTHMLNNIASNISWTPITVAVQDAQTGKDKDIVSHVSGLVEAGRFSSLPHTENH